MFPTGEYRATTYTSVPLMVLPMPTNWVDLHTTWAVKVERHPQQASMRLTVVAVALEVALWYNVVVVQWLLVNPGIACV